MDLWSVIPIGVHQYTILSTMVSSISLGNILWKDTTCKDLLGNEDYLVISFHHSTLQLTFITQAWMCEFEYLCHASKHMKCTYKYTIQVHELAPPTCVLKILIDPFPLSYLPPMSSSPPSLSFHHLSTLISLISFVSLRCTNFFVISPPIAYIFVSLPLCHQWPQRLKL